MRSAGKVIAVVAVMAAVGVGCGDDDGASVREIDGASSSGSASASGSGSAPASGSASGSAPASGSPSGTGECDIEGGASGEATAVIHGELTEFAISIEQTTVPAGLVGFEFVNAGAEPHEVAVVRGDDPSAVPTTDDGAVDDEALGDSLVGEIEPFPSGTTCTGTFDLSPGTYVLLCNIVEQEDDKLEAHFHEGMFTTLTVTG